MYRLALCFSIGYYCLLWSMPDCAGQHNVSLGARDRKEAHCRPHDRYNLLSFSLLHLRVSSCSFVSLPISSLLLFSSIDIPGHQRGIMFVLYSPDARLVASASLDKSAKIWDGRTAK